jgi:hypothetical protein
LPEVSTQAMQIYLDTLAATVAPDAHLLLVLDQAGWQLHTGARVAMLLPLVAALGGLGVLRRPTLSVAFTRTKQHVHRGRGDARECKNGKLGAAG